MLQTDIENMHIDKFDQFISKKLSGTMQKLESLLCLFMALGALSLFVNFNSLNKKIHYALLAYHLLVPYFHADFEATYFTQLTSVFHDKFLANPTLFVRIIRMENLILICL